MFLDLRTLVRALFAVALAGGIGYSASAAPIFLSLTNAGTVAASPTETFNTLNNAQVGAVALNDSTGAASGVSVTIATAPAGGNQTGSPGITTGSAADNAGITDAAGLSYHFTSDANVATYTFTGLTESAYNFTTFSSRNAGDARPTLISVSGSGLPQTAQPSGPVNNSDVLVFNSATPVAGVVTLSFNGTNTTGNQFGYLNAIKIDVVPEPASLALVGLGGLCMLTRRKSRS